MISTWIIEIDSRFKVDSRFEVITKDGITV